MCKDCGCETALASKVESAHHHHASPTDLHIHLHLDHAIDAANVHVHLHSGGHGHHHSHEHSVEHDHPHEHAHKQALNAPLRTIDLETRLLAKNDEIASRTRAHLKAHDVRSLNLISSPGAGKTLLLERTLEHLEGRARVAVIAGDQKTDRDAKRLANKGAHVIAVETHDSCHLGAQNIADALDRLPHDSIDLLLIENVGNLVCPAAFDLGEDTKVALVSLPEGEDKPLKYPTLFLDARVVLITKIDLEPHLDVSVKSLENSIRTVRPDAIVFPVSARTGAGMQAWFDWVLKR